MLDDRLEGLARRRPSRAKELYIWLGDERSSFSSLSSWFATHWDVSDGDELARTVGLWESSARLLDACAQLSAHGADTVILEPVGDERGQLNLIATDLLAALHKLDSVTPGG